MKVELATAEHIDRMFQNGQQAIEGLRAQGIDQWQKGYPSRQTWEDHVANAAAWVALEDGDVIGQFALQTQPDPSYAHIEGAWLNDDGPYMTVHSMCVAMQARGRGVAVRIFEFARSKAVELGMRSLRVDTHADNVAMQRSIEKAGFSFCGIITLQEDVEEGALRNAYELLLG